MVRGTNMVRKELGLPEAECLAADPRHSLALPAAPGRRKAQLRARPKMTDVFAMGYRRPRESGGPGQALILLLPAFAGMTNKLLTSFNSFSVGLLD
jgi:hypothetical protein